MSDNPPPNRQNQPASEGGQPPELDIKLLADKVYRLMLADIRLAQVCGTKQGNRRKRVS
jgi:hypothetical protein